MIEARGKKTQRDWLMAASWFEELAKERADVSFIQTSLTGLPLSSPIRSSELSSVLFNEEFDFAKHLQQTLAKTRKMAMPSIEKQQQWHQSVLRCKEKVFEDISGEIVCEHFLEPLWRIWRPLFEREMQPGQTIQMHRALFFQQVLSGL